MSGLVVIVAGVLLALAGDAAWSSRGDRIREQEVLADLLEEFKENEAILLTDIEGNRKALGALFRYSHEQGFSERELKIEDLFDARGLELTESSA